MLRRSRKNKGQFLDSIFGSKTTTGGVVRCVNRTNDDFSKLTRVQEVNDMYDSDKEGLDIENFEPVLNEKADNVIYDDEGNQVEQKKKKPKKVKSVKIIPVVSNVEAYGEAPHPHLLRPPFSLLVIAPKGSGKTTTTINVLDFYEGHFDSRHAWSPTLMIDDNWKAAFKKGTIEPFHKKNVHKRYNDDVVNKLWKTIKKENKTKENFSEKTKTLLLFDDIIGELPRTKSNACYKIARNHRHYGASAITISQEYCGLAPVIRKNATGLLIYGTTDGNEIKSIIDAQGGFIGKNRFFRMWCYCISKPFGFLFINKDDKHKHRYFSMFEEELNPRDFSNERVRDMIDEMEDYLSKTDNDNENVKSKVEDDTKLQEGHDTITNEKGQKAAPEIPVKKLHICKCKMNKIKDIASVCNNGLNLLAEAMGIEDTSSKSKKQLLELLSVYSPTLLKRVLTLKKKSLE